MASSFPPGAESAVVVFVTDGDTIDVQIVGDGVDTVRLIGINSNEGGECFAEEATTALSDILGDEVFAMTSDVSNRDQYDRLLRYLWLADGTFVNEELVRSGYAIARDYPPDSMYASRLAAAQVEAVAVGAGLWASDACGPESSNNLVITGVEYDAPGNDHENLNGEWVTIANQGVSAQPLTGWVLKDESATHRYRFPSGLTLGANSLVRVYTGCGTDTATEVYWCNSGAVWNNDGDTAFLLDPNGNVVDQYGY